MISTKRTRLVPFTQAHFNAIFENDTHELSRLLNTSTPCAWTDFPAGHEALNPLYKIFQSLKGDSRWGSYFIVGKSDREMWGTCCFKGRPDASGFVEIGYEVKSRYQNMGVATEVTEALIKFAFGEGLNGIVAHTLCEENASVKVLRKNGFQLHGQVIDPEDGPVWKWLLVQKT